MIAPPNSNQVSQATELIVVSNDTDEYLNMNDMEVVFEFDDPLDVTFNQVPIDQNIDGETSVSTLESNGNDSLESAMSVEDIINKTSG